MNTTHEVFNQPEPLVNYNLFTTTGPAGGAEVQRPVIGYHSRRSRPGRHAGQRRAMQTHARLANVHTPVLHSHDRFGRRMDQVEFHPSYHALMDGSHRRRPAWHAVVGQRAGHRSRPQLRRGRSVHAVHRAGALHAVPHLHDLRRHARAANQPGATPTGPRSSPAAPTTRRSSSGATSPA
jgi:hypothetical protein